MDLYSNKIKDIKSSSIRELFKRLSDPEFISLAGGAPDPTVFPKKLVKKIVNQVLEEEPEKVLQYGATAGFDSTKNAIVSYVNKTRGLNINVDNISITSGAMNAIDAILKVFIDEGDIVLTESPTYLATLTALKLRNANICQVEVENDGININELEKRYETNPPKLLYIIPNHQNPSGISTSIEKRKKIIQLIKRYGTILIEDDPYFELSYYKSPTATLYSMAPEQTIYIGSFSKVVSPGIRLGYAIASQEIINKISLIRQFNDVHSNNISQKIVEHLILSNEIYNVINNNKIVYKSKLEIVLKLIDEYFPKNISVTSPKGGMFIWIQLPESFDFKLINAELLNEKVGVVPGEEFYVHADSKKSNTFRINFTQEKKKKIEKGIIKIGKILNHQYKSRM